MRTVTGPLRGSGAFHIQAADERGEQRCGESCPAKGGHEPSHPRPEARPRELKIAAMERRGARTLRQGARASARAERTIKMSAPRGAPSPRHCRGLKEPGKEGGPARGLKQHGR